MVFKISILFFLCLLQHSLFAQEVIPFTSERWQLPKDAKLEKYQEQSSVFLSGNAAFLKDAKFLNGIIEYDVAFSEKRGFVAVIFRAQDNKNYEEFYLRPHQSGNPDANQYAPLYNGMSSWQLYYGKDFSAPAKYAFNQWMHVKLVISHQQMEVYLNDMSKPALFVPELKRPLQPGYLGVSSLVGEARFANFTYTPMDTVTLQNSSTFNSSKVVIPGTIAQWQVSNVFIEKKIEDKLYLSKADKEGLVWLPMKAEVSGLLNLAAAPNASETNNSVYAKISLHSDKAKLMRFNFGFSDRARIFLNDQLIYFGHDEFASRDYRFLGTIGFFDTLYLPLKKGRNELWVAVSEGFGGWGLLAQIEAGEVKIVE